MNFRIFALLFAFICLYITHGQAQEYNLVFRQCLEGHQQVTPVIQKIYVESSEIFFSNNQILVQTPKGLIQISELHSDETGFYYKTAHPQSWYCDNRLTDGSICGWYNTNTYYCEHCGKPPRKK